MCRRSISVVMARLAFATYICTCTYTACMHVTFELLMSRLTFARSAGAAGPKMTDVRYIYIYIYRQTDSALNS